MILPTLHREASLRVKYDQLKLLPDPLNLKKADPLPKQLQ